jgi:hypothetical protein
MFSAPSPPPLPAPPPPPANPPMYGSSASRAGGQRKPGTTGFGTPSILGGALTPGATGTPGTLLGA